MNNNIRTRLSPEEMRSVVHCLQVAAEQFVRDASLAKDHPRLHEQFMRQADEAAALAETFEEASAVNFLYRSQSI